MRQQRNVSAPLAQRGQPDCHHFKPIVKVFAKSARLDQLFQVLVGGGDQTHIRCQGLVGADTFEGPFAKEPQQFDLDRGIDFPDLIQEQRPALRLLHPPDPPFVGAGERPFFVPEQFALDKFARQSGAVHRHQRLTGARTELVNRPGDKFLDGSAFTRDQDV